MPIPSADHRSPERRLLDEKIATEPPLPPPDLSPGSVPEPLEKHLARLRRPLAIAGIVENGMIRPLDPSVKLPERSRVIIVASEPVPAG